MSPEAFVKDILVDRFRIRGSLLRVQLQFWIQGDGNAGGADDEGLKHGFGIHVQEPYRSMGWS